MIYTNKSANAPDSAPDPVPTAGQLASKTTTTSSYYNVPNMATVKKCRPPPPTPTGPPDTTTTNVHNNPSPIDIPVSTTITYITVSFPAVRKLKTKIKHFPSDNPSYAHKFLDFVTSYLQLDSDTF